MVSIKITLEGEAEQAPPKRLQLSINLHDVTSDTLEDRTPQYSQAQTSHYNY